MLSRELAPWLYPPHYRRRDPLCGLAKFPLRVFFFVCVRVYVWPLPLPIPALFFVTSGAAAAMKGRPDPL